MRQIDISSITHREALYTQNIALWFQTSVQFFICNFFYTYVLWACKVTAEGRREGGKYNECDHVVLFFVTESREQFAH
jgi:hypothetical protein